MKLSAASASRSWVATFLTSALKLPVALSPASASVVAGASGAAAHPPSDAIAASAMQRNGRKDMICGTPRFEERVSVGTGAESRRKGGDHDPLPRKTGEGLSAH